MAATILVIEDQPPVLKLLARRLKAHGYKVISAKDGQEGIEKVSSKKPDLIITDLAVPKMTGNVIIRILKQSNEFSRIPIIMLSAFIYGTENTSKEGVEFPADAYIAKPYDSKHLLAQVEELLERAGKSEEP